MIVLFLIECPAPPRPRAASAADPGLALFDVLASPGTGAAAIHPFQDAAGAWHIRVDISLARYAAVERRLDEEIKALSARVLKKEQENREGTVRFLWEIAGAESAQPLRATLLFLCPLEKTARRPRPDPMAAIIIDDAGFNLDLVRRLAGLGRPLTLAVLPSGPVTRESAETAHAAGLEVMLHLPLEPNGQSARPGAGTIMAGMSGEDIRRRVKEALGRVPWAKGVNNHTGSLATEDPALMMTIIEVLKERGLYFVDSRTSAKSVAYDAARALGVPAATRRVFLDQPVENRPIKAALEELFRTARRAGSAVGIGHARVETVEALRRYLSLADSYGVRLVLASEIVK